MEGKEWKQERKEMRKEGSKQGMKKARNEWKKCLKGGTDKRNEMHEEIVCDQRNACISECTIHTYIHTYIYIYICMLTGA